MGAFFDAVQHLLVLGFILLAFEPVKILANRKLTLHKLEKVIEDSEDLHSHLRIAEHKENVLLVSGELKQHVEIDNKWKIHLIVSRAAALDEEFHVVLNMPHMGVCDVMKSYYKEVLYEKLKEYSNAPHPNTCPLPPEHYHLDDYPLDVHLLKKLMTPGHYRFVSRLMKGEHIKLEYRAELELE
ncbi:hypothetical protein KR009_007971 [Drosophila setifemur]|nr:hypothetical protein KR009_007971 [Drosophila setifemur]